MGLRRIDRVECAKIVALVTLAAIVYGVVHDQVTVRICPEYFTLGHPPVFATRNPTLLALGWGVIATWWMGLGLGLFVMIAAQWGAWPRLSAAALVRPLLVVLAGMAICALLAGYQGARVGGYEWLFDWNISFIPEPARAGFVIDFYAHVASYSSSVIGGILLIVWILRRRRRAAAGTPTALARRH